jgi:hypothetical protein
MKEHRFQTFDEFWPHFVRAHENKATRTLHFAGTTGAIACITGGIVLRKPWLFALAAAVGYGPAWAAHFFIEKNRPATFDYPFWSLKAGLLMWSMILTGTMDAEVERVISSNGYDHREPVGSDGAVRSAIADEQKARRERESMN